MSEIAKCPWCGDSPDVLVDLFDKHGKYPKGYACCGAEFIELERWNQYAAAMKLAKGFVDKSISIKVYNTLHERVLEVFNG